VAQRLKEYAAAKNVGGASKIAINQENGMILVIRISSLIRLREGGAAILAIARKNQNIEKIGAIDRMPLDKIILRVLVIS